MAKKEWLTTGADGLTFGERLDDLIKKKGITANQLAKDTKIQQSAISEYISGKTDNETGKTTFRAPDCASLISLANYFSVSTDYLLGRTKPRTADLTAQDVISYTGLSEDNVKTLHDMVSSLGGSVLASKDANITWLDGNKPFIDCLNDLLESVYADRDTIMKYYIRLRRKPMKNETVDFWYVIGTSGPIAGFEPMEYSDSKAQIPFDNEQVEYLCSKIAKAIELSLLRKYFATPEDIARFEKDIDDEKLRNEMLRKQLEEGRNNGID